MLRQRDDKSSFNIVFVSGNGAMVKTEPVVSKVSTSGSELKDDLLKYYKGTGLEPVAREVMHYFLKLK